MAFATRNSYRLWVENALRALGRGSPQQVYRWIRANEAVPAADLAGATSDGESLFEKNVRWARFALFKANIVSNREGRGVWLLSSGI
jgi:hypothetical protein